MAGWHHRLDGHESEWTPGVGDGQGVLACCNSWGRKESDTTEQLNWTELNFDSLIIICLSMDPFEFIILGVHWASCIGQYLSSNLESFQQLLLQMFLLSLPLSSPSETWIMHICLLDVSLSSLIFIQPTQICCWTFPVIFSFQLL